MRWFKKWDPRQKVMLPDGQWFRFPIDAGDWGLVATEDSHLIRQFTQAIGLQRGGIEEINEGQFNELQKKKPTTSLKPFSEQISLQSFLRLQQQKRNGAKPVEGVEMVTTVQTREIARPVTTVTGFTPKSVRR